MAKMTSGLAEKFQAVPGEERLDVVLELGHDAMAALDGAGSVEQARNVFAGYTKPMKEKILSLGGDITGEAWLNGTLQAKLTRHAVESLDDEPAVARVDLPRTLARE